jgi:hypothetical protein
MLVRLLEYRPPRRALAGVAWAAVLVLGSIFLAGCSSPEEDLLSQGPVIIPRNRPGSVGSRTGARAPGIPEIEAMEILAQADDLRRADDYDRALQLLNDLATRNPPRTVLDELQRLRIDVKRHLLQSVYLDALVVLDKTRVTLGDPITGELVLVNLSDEELVVPASTRFKPARSASDRADRKAGRTVPVRSETTISEDLRYREFVANGTVVRRQRKRSQRLREDLVLQPGERHSWPIKVDSLAISPASVALREYVFSATLYPADIRIGTESFPGTLLFKQAVCRVFPRNWQDLLDDPLARLEEVVDKRSPPHIPLAAALVPEEQRRRAVEVIGAFLMNKKSITLAGPSRVACCVALRLLTGWDLPADPEVWIDRLKTGTPLVDRR